MQRIQKKRKFSTVYELTTKETEIVKIICEKGITKIDDIAQFLYLSNSTISTHLHNIYDKFRVHSVADLMFYYYKNRGITNDC